MLLSKSLEHYNRPNNKENKDENVIMFVGNENVFKKFPNSCHCSKYLTFFFRVFVLWPFLCVLHLIKMQIFFNDITIVVATAAAVALVTAFYWILFAGAVQVVALIIFT